MMETERTVEEVEVEVQMQQLLNPQQHRTRELERRPGKGNRRQAARTRNSFWLHYFPFSLLKFLLSLPGFSNVCKVSDIPAKHPDEPLLITDESSDQWPQTVLDFVIHSFFPPPTWSLCVCENAKCECFTAISD
jgi:hypothetical protein